MRRLFSKRRPYSSGRDQHEGWTVHRRADRRHLAASCGILRQAEAGTKTIRDVCRENNVTETTFYRWRWRWRWRFGSLDAGEAAKVRDLERENARLKRLLAERDLEVDVLREYLAKK